MFGSGGIVEVLVGTGQQSDVNFIIGNIIGRNGGRSTAGGGDAAGNLRDESPEFSVIVGIHFNKSCDPALNRVFGI